MGADNMPAAEVDIDQSLVRGLLADQHDDLIGDLTEVANGWDNAVFRLDVGAGAHAGESYAVRLPRRQMAAELVANEQRWLPELAPRLPLPIPAPVRVGRPDRGYPWFWSVCPWLDGTIAAIAPPDDLTATASAMAGFLVDLHQPAPPDAPVNPYRGGPLADREAAFLARAEQLRDTVDQSVVVGLWRRLARLPFPGRTVWLHGDLHPANLLVDGGRLVAVIDFGDISAGDPATDLAVAWTLFTADSRDAFRDDLNQRRRLRHLEPVDGTTWGRARGWALGHAMACLAHAADSPVMARIGLSTLDEVLADDG